MIQSACAMTAWWCSIAITEVQAGRRLVENVHGAGLGHRDRELQTLPLTA